MEYIQCKIQSISSDTFNLEANNIRNYQRGK